MQEFQDPETYGTDAVQCTFVQSFSEYM